MLKITTTIIVLLAAICTVLGETGTRVSITEDKEGRPTHIKMYYFSKDGKKILHGTSIEYNWILRIKTETSYTDGVVKRVIISEMGVNIK